MLAIVVMYLIFVFYSSFAVNIWIHLYLHLLNDLVFCVSHHVINLVIDGAIRNLLTKTIIESEYIYMFSLINVFLTYFCQLNLLIILYLIFALLQN